MFENRPIGFIEFDVRTPREDKLIDLRGLNLVKNDYAQLLNEYKKRKVIMTSK